MGMNGIKSKLWFLTYAFVCLICFIFLFELTYRYQLVDFYKPELRSNNSDSDLHDKSKRTILAMGDSFSVGEASWIGFLRPRLTDYRLITAAISGSGIVESLLVAPHRFREFNPEVFIYQIYVGNDIQDIRRPLNWHTMTLPRYIYCFACSYAGLRSLIFVNYRLAQLAQSFHADPEPPPETNPQGEFSPDTYLKSARLYFQAEPYNLDDTIMVKNHRRRDVDTLVRNLFKLFAYCRDNCRKYVVVIPDSAQVNHHYLNNMKKIGASFADEVMVLEDAYPFVAQLAERLAGKGIKVLNPLPLFKKSENHGLSVYYKNDPHLNPAGQALLGKFILENLRRDQPLN